MTPPDDFYARAERRIGRLTLLLGLGAAAVVALGGWPLAAAGLAVGTVLAWVNYRWLAQGVEALARVSTAQADAPKPRISISVYGRIFGRYVLIALVVYVMVVHLSVPILSVLAGLFALGAAAMAEGLYEVFTGSD